MIQRSLERIDPWKVDDNFVHRRRTLVVKTLDATGATIGPGCITYAPGPTYKCHRSRYDMRMKMIQG